VFSDSILFVYSSGSEGKPIVFIDYGDPEKPLPVITYTHNFCIWMRDREYLTFQNLEVAGGGEAVIELKQSAIGKTHHIVIKDCVIRGGNTGVWVDTALGGLVEGCEIYNCGTGFSSHDPGFTVRNCKIHDNHYGISVGTYDTIIEGNEIYNNEVGIRYGFGYGTFNTTFCRNLVRDNKSHGFETWYGVVNAGKISYNIFTGNGGDGIFLKNGVSGITIFNNVIYGNKKQGIHLALEKGNAPHGITIKNNIIMDNKGDEIKIAKGVADLKSDYNCVYRPVSTPLADWYGIRYKWEDWKRHSQQDVHSINMDPLFVNNAAGDFHLTVKSPCKNAGVDLDIEGMDYYGSPIPSGKVSMGVDQMQATKPDRSKAAASH
jgi:parallel beta-helix repeat protein